jgi:hypothetical protein
MPLNNVDLYRIDGTIGSVSNIQTAAINNGPIAGSRNRIINGDMRIDQRNAGAAINSAGDGTWTVDRWVCYHNIATVNVGQNLNSVASVNGFPNQLGIQITATATASGSQYTNFQHYVEGFNAADLAWGTSSAQSVTISFWVRSSVTGTHGAAIQNATSDLGYPFTYTISSANTWEYKTITIPGPTTGTWNTTNGRGITLIFDLGQGPSFRFTAGSWQSANVQGVSGAVSLNQTINATFFLTGIQLEPGTVATPFERRSYGQELALCQRYFEPISKYERYAGASSIATAFTQISIPFKISKRNTSYSTYWSTATVFSTRTNLVQFFSPTAGGDVQQAPTISATYLESITITGSPTNGTTGGIFFGWIENEL